ncbi:MAG: cell division protein ZapB [Desulfobulbaceae bacterium]|jgi:chromosome segregation ATPase|nr:cell division protein ZapB [Desulfobulbaceae bacterium]MDY0350248.1 cell division protein ZapB [Desulfobulbaceae bacterium]
MEDYVMENNTELVRLEQFVDNLLTKHKELRDSYRALESRYAEKSAECEKLKDTIAELRTERSEVGSRVSGLLGRIEQWETEQKTADTGQPDKPDDSQGKLFHKERAGAK